MHDQPFLCQQKFTQNFLQKKMMICHIPFNKRNLIINRLLNILMMIQVNKFQQHTKMNKRQQQHFAAFFQQIYETQQILDFIKQKLVESRNFNSKLLFELISARTQKITIQQMKAFLEDKVAVNERELYEIFERFDWTRQGFISRDDFEAEIFPFSNSFQPNTGRQGTISAQIQGHFISLIVQILKRFRIVEVARKQIKYIQPYDAFKQIDYLKIGHIGIGELRKLFFDSDFNVTDKQLYLLLHGLRRRCYRDINLEVFCQNLNPLEFGEYWAYQHEIENEKEKKFLNQNRREEETMRRSRVQSQRIQHQFQKSQRKKQAELERQLELENKASMEIIKYQQEKQRQIRRALMEQDKNIRHQRAACEQSLRLEHLRNQQDRIENEFLNSRKQYQEEINFALAQSALQRQEQLQRSRRELQRERNNLYEQNFQRQFLKSSQIAMPRELEFSKRQMAGSIAKNSQRQALGKIQNQSRKIYNQESSRKKVIDSPAKPPVQSGQAQLRKKYEYDLSADIQDSNVFESSRTRDQTNRRIQKQSRRIEEESRRRYYDSAMKSKYERQQELSKIKPPQEFSYTPMSNNKANDYEKQLEQTRYEIQERRNRRLAEQSAKSIR